VSSPYKTEAIVCCASVLL